MLYIYDRIVPGSETDLVTLFPIALVDMEFSLH